MSETNQEDLLAGVYILMVSICAGIAGFLFGYDTGVVSGALHFISLSFGLTDQHFVVKELVVGSVPAGALIGALVSSKISDMIGRRAGIVSASILFTIGTTIVALAMNIHAVILGRLLIGLGVGLSAVIVPMYLSEVSPPRIRGAVVFLFQLAITVGLMSAFIANHLFASTAGWRLMFAVAIIPSFVLGLTMITLPRSPRWLMLAGRFDEAKSHLRKLRGNKDVSQEFSAIEQSVSRTGKGWTELFSPTLFPLVVITVGLFEFQQLSGINAIFYYAPTIFESGGFADKSAAMVAAVALGCTNVVATLLGVCLVDVVGRRRLLLVGFAGMIVSLCVLGAIFNGWIGDPHSTEGRSALMFFSLGATLVYVIFFAFSLGGIPYVVIRPSLFPLRVRAAGMATASCANWGTNLVVSGTFLSLVQRWGIGDTFWMFSVLTCVGFVFTYLLFPETKGQTLEAIEADLYARRR